ncbi:MAG: Eco57I restriction-modification methylase domain-containing protein [Cyanobacteria bacterium MAG CAR3_bin_5]|nr:Eco57I restriction-modification methylase domain-containing protein [Cyanobacteria bacterium MAG CAR3_bin_5]
MTLQDSIQAALAALAALAPGDSLPQAATSLFAALGYRSTRVLEGQSGRVEDFIAQFPAPTAGTVSEQKLQNYARAIHILFQVTDEEINKELSGSGQDRLFDPSNFDKGLNKSYLFLAVELNQPRASRSQYAEFTREINKRFPMPAFLLFRDKKAGRVTLAFVQRRRHKRHGERQVLGSVSLVRDIDPGNPHRAHREILKELSLPHRLAWMAKHGKPNSFDGLLAALLASLDTQELNKRFYKDLFGWFNRAVAEARFPTNQKRTLPPQEHVIRLITRLLFMWFIKEKGLVAEELFIEEYVRSLLENYDPAEGDSYYRAVLQNLFFATLNTEISQRGFSARQQKTHRDFSRYRHQNEMADPDRLLALFRKTPFINGGLFDCLDSFESISNDGYRIDCFSDNPGHRNLLSVPNRLFFAADGLVTIFNRYKFTVEENTPIEQEVALDPELLGKVFENLLAAINPETRETARRQTGSYYTPRLVVDTMVEEALVAALGSKVQPHDGDRDYLQERLRYLLDYEDAFNDARELFEDDEAKSIVGAIASLKVLDPAVGSGAFPMGILHKLTLALQRLDPDNRRWEALQKAMATKRATAAFDTSDQQNRDEDLKDISATFERYKGSDFGRKLYLIQNSIFGVDIQPVACQIAKLRFFISLAIEQQTNTDPSANYGVKPLPNLETRFVAANTLLALAGGQSVIPSPRTQELEQQLRANRERYFHAKTRNEKLQCQTRDRQLRNKLTTELQNVRMEKVNAEKIAAWDPYDQNASTDWFDAGYMFGVADGFDVVIGNPPYNQLQEDGGKLGNLYKNAGYMTFARTGDIYQLFYERGCRMLRAQQGILAYITSNSWLKAEYGKKTRRYLAEHHTPTALLELGKDVFESAIVDSSILLLRQGGKAKSFPAVDLEQVETTDFPPPAPALGWGSVAPEGDVPWSILSVVERSVLEKMRNQGTPLKNWEIKINYGIKTGYNQAFIIDTATKETLVAADPKSAEIIKPVLRGRDIYRYSVDWKRLWLIATLPALSINIDNYPAVREYLLSFGKARLEQSGKKLPDGNKSRKRTNNAWHELQDACAYYEEFAKEKLFWMDMSNTGRFAYSEMEMYCNDKGFILTGKSLKYLCAVLNSTIIKWLVENTALTTGLGVVQWKKFVVERLPIPKISTAQQKPFIQLIDHILQAKATNPSADTSALEAEIDCLVYQLYELTAEEIAVVERSSASPGRQAP